MIGHEEAWQAWRAAMAGERMHHGWLLAGREGLGKASFARAAAAELVAEPGVPQPAVEAHPDILVLSPLPSSDDEAKKRDEGKPYQLKRNISVDQVRALQRRLNTRPTLGARRAVIIDSADLLEKSAVNALLKSLEEPPQGTFFLLVVHALGRLLPTVRSRCLIVRFHPLSDADVARALDLAAPELDAETRRAALAVAGGSPGAALAFAEQDLGRAQAVYEKLIAQGDADLALRGALAGAIGTRPDRERLGAAIEAARMTVVRTLDTVDDAGKLRLVQAHARLVRLAGEAPIYNFDVGMLAMEIGSLLAAAAPPREGVR
ncbi:MAG: DNA polymerase III subunit delta' [Novosphingobium sp. 28-62-57]|uniref:DNA polymerase III subunit delta' n=1 Tax=unclassified Novosphingobium TaxID=2644732 RepID=UPI000BD3F987|nr:MULTISPECIES: DNA polymerase III subunit delta' [unclassified Novosphingobium]OYW49564.1 MAG: DNA polymerase III subunit delta' [Novosphingobium sp. 12-62-10]OYZ12480.1 MAG: DNA polymerase III subunit delta' [Novosphingobium sp. 28-62-57]OZA31253.1 MAG: DNA polymerase III subunit delta' [Novosphingobium sp. 17-62-9]HQS69184.1 DNA polymerase III subunit delta' [Novosphingobium sp.]